MSRDIKALAALFAVAGVGHFVKPEAFESIVPRQLPAKRELVLASGVAELACSAGLLYPRTRKIAGLASAALLVGVYPANVSMTLQALRSTRAPSWYKAGTIARLPLQLPMIRTALKAAQQG